MSATLISTEIEKSNGQTPNVATVAPLQKIDRIVFLDCVRGMALLGILLMNSMAQSQSHVFYDSMNLDQPITGPNFYVWILERGVFEGTMRGLFSILFGAGTFLLISRLVKSKEGMEPADFYFRRLLWLLFFGLVNAFIFLWPGDILYPYALCGFLLFPFRNLSPKNLLIGALLLLALGTYRQNMQLYEARQTISKGQIAEKLQTNKQKLTDQQDEDLKEYQGFKESASSEGIMKKARVETKKVNSSNYLEMVKYYKDVNMKIQSVFFYNSWWDILLMFFVGMALLKSGFIEGRKQTALYAAIAVIGISIGISLNYYQLKMEYSNKFNFFNIVQQQKFVLYDIRRFCQTLGYLSVLILLYKIISFRKVFLIFAPVGQMAFTNYLTQSIITSIIFYGFGWYGKLQRYEVYYVVVAIWVFQIIASNIWLRYFRFGPFEWLWRSLTYKTKQPMLRPRKEVDTIAAVSMA